MAHFLTGFFATRRRWKMHGLICLVIAASLIDRSTLSVAMPAIAQDLGLSGVQIGLTFSAFLWVYAFAQVPAALLVDRFGIRRVILVAAAAWTIVTGLTGFAAGFAGLILLRVLLGVSEAPVFPAAIKVVHSWFGRESRGRALAIIEMVVKLGFAVSPLIGALLVARYGWRPMFFILGGISLVPTVLWYFHFRTPETDPHLTQEERALIETPSAQAAGRSVVKDWLDLFRHRETWLLMVGGLTLAPILAIGYWLPMFLKTEWKLGIVATGQVMTVIGAAGVFGALLGGLLADWLVKRGWSVIGSGRLVIVAGLLLGVLTLAIANYGGQLWIVVVALALNSFATSLIYAPAWSLAAAIAPRDTLVASMGGLQNCGVAAGAGIATLVTGALLDSRGDYRLAFDLSAFLALASAFAYAFLIRKKISITDG